MHKECKAVKISPNWAFLEYSLTTDANASKEEPVVIAHCIKPREGCKIAVSCIMVRHSVVMNNLLYYY